MAKLTITPSVEKFLSALPPKQYKQISSAIFHLTRDPLPHDSLPLKKARHGERRVDVGEYRVIYRISGDTVEVLLVGKRNDDEVYKDWKRLN
jgi:mRNA interferase RelE/StbE